MHVIECMILAAQLYPMEFIEGCTIFVFLAEHRDSAHGPPWDWVAIPFHGYFHGIPPTLHGLSRALHELPPTFYHG